jgi:hypothetical protein
MANDRIPFKQQLEFSRIIVPTFRYLEGLGKTYNKEALNQNESTQTPQLMDNINNAALLAMQLIENYQLKEQRDKAVLMAKIKTITDRYGINIDLNRISAEAKGGVVAGIGELQNLLFDSRKQIAKIMDHPRGKIMDHPQKRDEKTRTRDDEHKYRPLKKEELSLV